MIADDANVAESIVEQASALIATTLTKPSVSLRIQNSKSGSSGDTGASVGVGGENYRAIGPGREGRGGGGPVSYSGMLLHRPLPPRVEGLCLLCLVSRRICAVDIYDTSCTRGYSFDVGTLPNAVEASSQRT